MRKKIGTVVVLDIKDLNGEVYLGEGNVLTTSIATAKAFRASKKVLDTICTQAKANFPNIEMRVSTIERWSE